MSSLEEIYAQIKELTRHADDIKTQAKSGVISEVREKIALYGLTAHDLGFNVSGDDTRRNKSTDEPRAKVTAKYRDAQGNEWAGRGRKPLWVQKIINEGGNIEDYRIVN